MSRKVRTTVTGKLKRVDGRGQLSTRFADAPKRSAVVASFGGQVSSMFIDGKVNGKNLKLLLDTGATMTLMRPDLVCDKKRIIPTKWTLRTATGESASVYGETVANFHIGSTTFDHQVLVADIEEAVILGMDVMAKYGFKLDLKKRTLKIEDEDVFVQEHDEFTTRVFAAEVVTIPKQSEILVRVYLDCVIPDGHVLVVESNANSDAGKGVLIARALIQAKKDILVRLMNINDYPVTIKEGAYLSMCSSVSSVTRRVCSVQVSSEDVPKHLEGFLKEACKELTEEQSKQIRMFVARYQDVFENASQPKGRTNVVRHRIDTGNARPIRQIPRRLPLAKRAEADQIIQDMERDRVIEPSSSPWCSPVVLVRKKDGSTRFCVDFRQLNNVTKKDSYPLPRIDDTLDTLAGCKIFSTLDLKSGYWQVGLEPKDREKTAFSVGSGLWQFTVMPFGLCNAPATFERLMESVLRGLSWETCLVYLDDIIVLGRSFEEHLQNLEQVFLRLRAANLKLNCKKCTLFRKQVNYLGHVVSEEGVAVDPEKIRAVRDWPTPKNKHEVRSFLGLSTYYRRFVPGFADIAKPLTRLTEENSEFIWDLKCQHAFEELKKVLIDSPILSYPRTEGKFILDTDASNIGIGSVLSQMQDGQERVIAYFSKVLSKPERNYCVTRRELLAVIKSVEHFRKYLYGRKFLLRTDHSALVWLLRFKNPEGQVARWIERLQEYDYDSEHRAGLRHRNADALSRRPCPENCQHCNKAEERFVTVCRTTVIDNFWQDDEIRADQLEDPDLGLLMQWKEKDRRPSWGEIASLPPSVKLYWAQWQSIVVENGLLKRILESEDGTQQKQQLLIPRKRVPDVLKLLHDDVSGGHLGVKKTTEKVRQRFYWVHYTEDVKDWCRRCVVCASSNGPQKRRRAPMRQYNVGSPFERIAIDIAGPFPTTERGNKYILVAMDYFSKWTEAYALPNQEATTVAEVLVRELISRFGVPLELHSDQGRNFESAVFQQLCEALGIRKTRTTALHPQSDGMVERLNRTIGKFLSKAVSDHQKDWDEYIHLFLLAYRSAIHETTGQTPASVIFGRELRLPCDLQYGAKPGEDLVGEDYVTDLRRKMNAIHDRVRTNIQVASDKMKERYDVQAVETGYQTGDLVWLFNPQRRRGYSPKLQKSWEGPYEVIKRINDVIYRIRRKPSGKPRVVHFNRLAPFKGDSARDEQN